MNKKIIVIKNFIIDFIGGTYPLKSINFQQQQLFIIIYQF